MKERDLKQAEKIVNEQKAINTQYDKLAKLNDIIIQLQKDNSQLSESIQKKENELDQYIKKEDHFKVYFSLEVILVLWFFMSIVYGIYEYFFNNTFSWGGIISALAPFSALLVALTRKKLYVIDGSNIHSSQIIELRKIWEQMNPEYGKDKSRKEQNMRRIIELEKEVNTIKENIPTKTE